MSDHTPQTPEEMHNPNDVIVVLPPPLSVYNLGPAYSRPPVGAVEPTDKDIIDMMPQPSQPAVHVPSLADEYHDTSKRFSELDSIAEAQALAEEERKAQGRLLEGFDNDDLMALLRAFDNQVHHVHACPPPYDEAIHRGLDLQPADDEEFTVDKFRSCLERFYASFGIGVLRLRKELKRIQRWEEGGQRTVVALLIYIEAWCSELIIATLLLFIAALIYFPPFRHFCFDPPRREHVIERDGALDAVARDPLAVPKIQHSMGDGWGHAAVEKQATRWADNVSEIIKSLATPEGGGKGAESLQNGVKDKVSKKVDEEVEQVQKTGNKSKEEGDEQSRKQMATELYAQPAMRILGGLVDKWERIANSISPVPPSVLQPHRTRVFAFLVLPLLLASICISARMWARIFGGLVGVIIFGQPLIDNIHDLLLRIDAHWFEKLLLKFNILEDVPTHAQLVLRLLRDAEHQRRPLPPPSNDPEDIGPDHEGSEEEEEEEENEEEEEAGHGDGEAKSISSRKDKVVSSMSKASSKMVSSTRAKLRRTWDKVGHKKEEGFAALAGHKDISTGPTAFHAKDTSEGLHSATHREKEEGPSRYYVYHPKHGPGHLFIHPPYLPAPGSKEFTPARITFTTFRRVPKSQGLQMDPDEANGVPTEGHLTISINDIVSLKKENNMKWPGRIATSWLLDAKGAGGTALEIGFIRRGVHEAVFPGVGDGEGPKAVEGKEETVTFGGIVRRNELFDRLLALGEQRWEMF